MDVSHFIDRVWRFKSGTDKLLFVVIVGAGLAFVCYLVGDAIYHKWKWRRVRKKFAEFNAEAEEWPGKPPGPGPRQD